MKRILFATIIVALFGLTCCKKKNDVDGPQAKCYKVTYSAGVLGAGGEVTVYEWLTEEQIATQREKYEREGFTNIVFTEMPGYTTSVACYALGNGSEYLN